MHVWRVVVLECLSNFVQKCSLTEDDNAAELVEVLTKELVHPVEQLSSLLRGVAWVTGCTGLAEAEVGTEGVQFVEGLDGRVVGIAAKADHARETESSSAVGDSVWGRVDVVADNQFVEDGCGLRDHDSHGVRPVISTAVEARMWWRCR